MTCPLQTNLDAQPQILKIDDKHYLLMENYTYTWKKSATNLDNKDSDVCISTSITIKKGFRYDGASVPKFLWKFGLEPDGKHRAAALVHDFIYIHKGKLPLGSIKASYESSKNHAQTGTFSRKDADRLFGKIMKEAGVKPSQKKIMKLGVTFFGWIYWPNGRDLIFAAIVKITLIITYTTILFLLCFN